jgi:hypothetical protein
MPLDYYTPDASRAHDRMPLLAIISFACAAFPAIAAVLGLRMLVCLTMPSPLVGFVIGFIAYLQAPRRTEWLRLLALSSNAAVLVIAVLGWPHYLWF